MQKLNNKWVILSSAAVAITWAGILWVVIPSAELPEWRRVPLEVLRADPPKPQIFKPKDEPQQQQPRDSNVTTTGPVFPTATTNDSAYGSIAWTNPNNASADDTSYATVVNNDSLTNYLNPAFSPSIGSDEVIDGIEVTVNRKCTGGCVDDTVRLVFGGVVVGTNKSTGAVWTSSDASVTFGGPTDTWGLTPTFADVNTMEVVFASQMSDVIDTASVDYITVTIYHHTGTPDPDAFRAIIEARARQQRESMWTLRQSTSSQEVPLGMFVDETDGVTPLTALTIANTEIKLQPNGATSFTNKNSGGATHISNGHYYAVLDSTDTATVGPMKIVVDKSGALPVSLYCDVLSANQYDFKYGSTAPGTGTALDAAGVRSAVGLASANLDTQLAAIDDYLDTEVAAIKAKTDNLPSDPADASDIASAFTTVNGKLDAIDDYIDTEVANIVTRATDIQSRLPAALVSGRMDSSVGAMAANTLTASALATDAVTEIQSGLATATDGTVVKCGAAFTSTAGTEVRISAWLERSGEVVVLPSGECTVSFREHGSGTDLFSVTDSAPNAQGIFELTQSTPGFTSDRLYVASVEIEDDTAVVYTSRQAIPVR